MRGGAYHGWCGCRDDAAPPARSLMSPENASAPVTPPVTPKPGKKPEPEIDRAHIPLTEEFDRAKWTLPPVGVLLIGILAVAVVIGLVAVIGKSKPPASGGIGEVNAVELGDHNSVLVTINLNIANANQKRFWIQAIHAKLSTDKGDYSDDPANASDFDRYFQGFPDLKRTALDPLPLDAKIDPGQAASGTIIVSFPVSKDAFDHRKSLSVEVQPYSQAPVTFTK